MKRTLLTAVAFMAAVMSCKRTDVIHGNYRIPITLDIMPETKVSDNAFDPNDRIGLFVVNDGDSGLAVSGNHVDNMGFTFSEGKWIPDKEIYWKDSDTQSDFYVYYPYSETVESIDDYRFTIASDQSSEDKYKSCEFLWGRKDNVDPTESAVGITARHLMSNLVIVLKPGNGFSEADLQDAEVRICGTVQTAKIDLSTGAVSATGVPTEIIPKNEDGYFRALVVPQNITGRPLVKVIIGETVYSLDSTINFESGKQHRCTVNVNKMSNGINIGIDGWVTDDVDYGGDAN